METSIKNNYKIKSMFHAIVGIVFLLIGIAEATHIINFTSNNKIFFGLAIIAFGAAIAPFINYYLIKKDPSSMETVIVAESDERNISIKNAALAKSYSILRWILLYVFFAYTFLFPKEALVTFGWWSITLICLGSNLLSLLIYFYTEKMQ